MRNISKKILAVATAAVLSAGALSLAACGANVNLPAGSIPQGDVTSNGGFVVSIGDEASGYYYFINGVETYTSDNTYGTPVKGALMRAKKSDLSAGNGHSELIVPSLMVAGDYSSGIFIYGDRVYYATPTNVRNTEGVVENTYLDFKSAKLDGTDIKDLFRLSSNTTVYRFVEVDGTVYAVYAEGSSSYTLHSYNTAKGVDTVLADGVTAYLLNSVDKTDPVIYYTMSVTEKIATDGARTAQYNQLYRVNASATEVPDGYAYKDKSFWDDKMDWIDENNGGEIPYTNLGEIVLDGIDSNSDQSSKTVFNHSEAKPISPFGYTYTLRSYKNGGVYFTLAETNGKGGDLYYLPASAIGSSGFDSVASNPVAKDSKQCVKLANNIDAASKATDAAYFYVDGDASVTKNHHYLYVNSSCLYRVDLGEGDTYSELMVASDVGSATIVDVDMTSDSTYDYVYFTRTNGNGLSVERAVFNGKEDNYKNLSYEDEDNAAFKPAKLLNIQHVSGWYNYEIIDGTVFFADAEQFGGTAYSYTSAVRLLKDGKLMNNVELEAFNDRYEAVTSTDKAVGLFGKLNDAFGDSDLSNAIKYYFYTGKSEQFWDNIKEATETYGQKETSLYTEEEQKAFDAYVKKEEYKTSQGKVLFGAGEREQYDSFRIRLGEMNEADKESFAEYWKTSGLAHYTPPAEEETGLAWWAWLLIAIAIALVVAAGVMVALYFLYYKKNQKTTAAPRRRVRTQVDEDIDVYADETSEPETPDEAEEPAENAEEALEDEAEAEPEEAPAEEAGAEEVAAEPEEVAAEPVNEEPAAPAEEAPAAPETTEPPADSAN